MSYGLPSTSRLKSRSSITSLFARHSTRNVSPLRCMYTKSDSTQVMVSVPKRLFKRAVKRNLLKRRIREAYRLHRDTILGGIECHIAFVYTTAKECSSSEIENAVVKILKHISEDKKS